MNKIMFLFILIISANLKTSTADTLMTDHNYILTTTQIAKHPTVVFPRDVVPDSLYKIADTIVSYRIKFSETFDSVFIDSLTIGTKDKVDSEKIYFSLGLGRFVIWKYNSILFAELTQYGFGVPIIKSERGILSSTEKTKLHIVNIKSLRTGKIITGSQNNFLLNGRSFNYFKVGISKRKINNFYLKSVGNEIIKSIEIN